MFRRILFPTDFSDYARRVMDCIADLPGVEEVVVVHVISTDKPASLRGDMTSSAKNRIESDATILKSLGIPSIKSEVLVSESIASGIDDAATRNNSTIIVMGARGKSIIKGLHLGSVTHRILHDSKKNLLIMRGEIIETLSGEKFQKYCPRIFSRVLVPVDLTPESWTAVEQLAKIPDVGEIIVAFVISRGETERELERIRIQAEQDIQERCKQIQTAGAEIRHRILEGDLVSRILDYAQEADVSLISTVPTEKGFFAEMLHGSFSCELARLATKPVLVIRRS
ncbi:universal stress protein [Methanospirillum hungatei]|uniref:universal stress protein n=1 Tax=Methanospirillum hungatei TaxID=2203 RepID=UPI0026F03063|nr:universal stress protein [Methanospirillum hungatei]MCA1914868.1 universal stress protein [Methanospirillum hungatei]